MSLAEEIFSQKAETTLFHYTTQKGLLGICKSRTLWTTNIYYLNDSKEFKYSYDLLLEILQNKSDHEDISLEKVLANIVSSKTGVGGCLSKSLSKILSFGSMPIYVLSFSEKGDLLSQWRAYGEKGSGFSIGFEPEVIETLIDKNEINGEKFKVVKCSYDRVKQEKLISEILVEEEAIMLEIKEAALEKKEISELQDDVINKLEGLLFKFIQIAPILKHPSFEEEQEWRLVSPLAGIKNFPTLFRESDSMIIPYCEFKIADDDEPLPFSTVKVGPTPYEDLSLKSTKMLFHSLDSKGIKVEN